MATRSRKIENELRRSCEELNQRLSHSGPEQADLDLLGKLLESAHALDLHRAALICRKRELAQLDQQLLAAFERALSWGARKDPACLAKTELARALVAREKDCLALFRCGLNLRQPEPVWGGSRDTAAGLRVACATGLVQCGSDEVLDELAEMLADPEVEARRGAVRALVATGNPLVTPLLRLKSLLPEEDADTKRECLRGLLQVGGAELIGFVQRWLDPEDVTHCSLAAMALCDSALPAAVAAVMDCTLNCRNEELLEMLMLALAGSASGAARAFLLEQVRGDQQELCESALLALDTVQDPRILAELREHFAEAGRLGEDLWDKLERGRELS